MTTQQVADQLVSMCREGKFQEAVAALYADDIVSVEAGGPPGQSREMRGLDNVKGKGEWWAAHHEFHSSTVEGPIVAGDFFSVAFKLDLTFKPENRRFTLEEVAVYKVKDGKVAYEQFFYAVGA